MKNNNSFLLLLIALAFIGTFFVMKPFLLAIFMAFILATMFNKSNKKLRKKLKGSRAWSSFLMCLWVMVILIIPFLIVIGMVLSETDSLLQEYQTENFNLDLSFTKEMPILNNFDLNNFFKSEKGLEQITKGAQNIGNFLFTAMSTIYKKTSSFAFTAIVCFFSLYYFFKDGDLFIKKLIKISPLPASQEKELMKKFNTMTVATIKGTLLIALIQGILMGIIFWIAGVKAPTLWGIVTAIVSIIPLLGPFLIWLPAGLIMLFLGNIWQGVFILSIGAILVSSIDNFLRPKLIESETSLHPLLVFLSTLGGIAFFGPLGFVVGPVLITFLISLLDIQRTGHVQN